MKNLFNDISQDEKNRILEMHSGKKNVISEDVPTGMDTAPTGMNTNMAVVTPKDYVLTDHAMGHTYPFLVKKNTPLTVNNGIVTIKGFTCDGISGSHYDVRPKDVKIIGNNVTKFNCKTRIFDFGEEKGGLNDFIVSKLCRK